MNGETRLKEISESFLHGELDDVGFAQEIVRVLYINQDHELCKWLAEQILISKEG